MCHYQNPIISNLITVHLTTVTGWVLATTDAVDLLNTPDKTTIVTL
jgi:hypothetical protein